MPVDDPITGTPLAPQNIWGAMFTSGGLRENGDRYGPAYLGNGAGGAKGDPNPDYDANGYDYTVELSGGATNGRSGSSIRCSARPATTATAARSAPATTGPTTRRARSSPRSRSPTACTT